MRLNLVYFKKHPRSPQNVNKVPFKQVFPLALQNSISGAARSSLEDKCLFEMSLLFACWKENEFNNVVCNKFIEKLQDCHTRLTKTLEEQKEQKKKDVPTPETKVFTDKQLTYLLRKYPTV